MDAAPSIVHSVIYIQPPIGDKTVMVGKFLAGILGLAGVVAGSQAPNFTNNFMQNLEGRVAERQLDFDRITERWDYFNVTSETAAENCNADASANSNPQASCLEDVLIVERYESLSALQSELKDATIWERPILLGRSLAADSCKAGGDVELSEASLDNLSQLCLRNLAASTMEEFEPAIPVTADGAAYAAGGGAGIWAVFRILFGLVGMPFRSRYAY